MAPLIWRVYDEALKLAGREHPTVRAQRALAERISRMNGTSLDPDVRESLVARDEKGRPLNRLAQYADIWKDFSKIVDLSTQIYELSKLNVENNHQYRRSVMFGDKPLFTEERLQTLLKEDYASIKSTYANNKRAAGRIARTTLKNHVALDVLRIALRPLATLVI